MEKLNIVSQEHLKLLYHNSNNYCKKETKVLNGNKDIELLLETEGLEFICIQAYEEDIKMFTKINSPINIFTNNYIAYDFYIKTGKLLTINELEDLTDKVI